MTRAKPTSTITDLRYQAVLHGAANIEIRVTGLRGSVRFSIGHATYGTLVELDKIPKGEAYSYSSMLLAELDRLRAVERGSCGKAIAA